MSGQTPSFILGGSVHHLRRQPPSAGGAPGGLVTKKSGVLNLGVEGMMLVGAVVRLCRHPHHRQCGYEHRQSSAADPWAAR